MYLMLGPHIITNTTLGFPGFTKAPKLEPKAMDLRFQRAYLYSF